MSSRPAQTPKPAVSTLESTKPNTLITSTEVSAPLRVAALLTKFLWCVLVSAAIHELLPNAITLRNQIPKSYLHYDLYCNLIPNDDPNVNFYD